MTIINKAGSQASMVGPEDWFTGTVRIDPMFAADDNARASATTAMTHIAIQEAQEGRVVEWLEKVSDEQYGHTESFSD